MPFKYSSIKWILLLSLTIMLILFIRISIINVASISSGSMLPNYEVHSHIISNQLSWGLNIPFKPQQVMQWKMPQRGDTILFSNPHDDSRIWMKRVIGLPGDNIVFRNHQLYVNDRLCTFSTRNKEHLPRKVDSFSPTYKVWSSYLEKDWGPIHVPTGKLFLMGDNRGDSIDSRLWGSISIKYLKGKPIARVWPLSEIAWLPQ